MYSHHERLTMEEFNSSQACCTLFSFIHQFFCCSPFFPVAFISVGWLFFPSCDFSQFFFALSFSVSFRHCSMSSYIHTYICVGCNISLMVTLGFFARCVLFIFFLIFRSLNCSMRDSVCFFFLLSFFIFIFSSLALGLFLLFFLWQNDEERTENWRSDCCCRCYCCCCCCCRWQWSNTKAPEHQQLRSEITSER